tara:strand:+ start:22764 stop:23246 length:483 start_codon:yes stop_codon:yes gene_type:complete
MQREHTKPQIKTVFFKHDYYAAWCLKVVNSLLNKLDFKFVKCDKLQDADIVVEFRSNDDIVKSLGSEFDGLSAASLRGASRFIYFNKERFINPPRHFPNKVLYRRYLVRHEFIHTLGVPHRAANGGKCSIMTHQTKLEDNCLPNDEFIPGDIEFIRNNIN